jgi:peptide/nickel transport system ATP-binding protein
MTLSLPDTDEFLWVGCRFADRCPRVLDVCRRVVPTETVVNGRTVKCHLDTNGSG